MAMDSIRSEVSRVITIGYKNLFHNESKTNLYKVDILLLHKIYTTQMSTS